MLKHFALPSSGITSSSTVDGKWLRFQALLSGLRSKHICSFPLGFLATTIPDTQSVGLVSCVITPSFSRRNSSFPTSSLTGNGILLSGLKRFLAACVLAWLMSWLAASLSWLLPLAMVAACFSACCLIRHSVIHSFKSNFLRNNRLCLSLSFCTPLTILSRRISSGVMDSKRHTAACFLKGEVRRKMNFIYVLGFVVLRDVVKVSPVSSPLFVRKTTGRNRARSHSGGWRGLKTKWDLKLSLPSPTYPIRYLFFEVGTTTPKLKLDAFQLWQLRSLNFQSFSDPSGIRWRVRGVREAPAPRDSLNFRRASLLSKNEFEWLLPLFFMQLLLSHMFLSFMVRTSLLTLRYWLLH